MTPEDPAALRALVAALRPHAGAAGVDAALDRLERDLLPRTAGGHDHLVVGLVGPNNGGKSALFNAIVGGAADREAPAAPELSPSRATGGATRRLVGAASQALREALESETTLERFALRGVTPGPDGAEEATLSHEPGRAHELLLVTTEALPDSLLVVDTPDFDSVLRENRAVTDALLTVVDVAVAVVTRHTYQNREVVDFLRAWLEHGRPWVLVYNESIDDETTRAHAAKLTGDIGAPPEAVFAAPFDREVAAGRRALVPLGLDGEGALGPWLRGLGDAGELKRRALGASLTALRAELDEVAVRARAEAGRIAEVEAVAGARARALGAAVARDAMPMGPFLAAFRDVLDERPTRLQRELRRGVKWTSRGLERGARWAARTLRGRPAPRADEGALERTLMDAEGAALARHWGDAFERCVTELRAALEADGLPPDAADPLRARLRGPDAAPASAALAEARGALDVRDDLMEEYEAACRRLIADELDRDPSGEWLMQLGVDALHLLPLGVAGAVIVHTGGLGADVAVAGGGALSAAAAERMSRALGTGVASAARRRWVELREVELAEAALAGLVGREALGRLRDARASREGLARAASGEIPRRTT